jgi:ribonuclease R
MWSDPQRIVALLREAGRPMKPKEIAAALRVPEGSHAELRDLLEQLDEDGVLHRVQRQRYTVSHAEPLREGRLQTTRGGAGFVIPADRTRDIYIAPDALGTAVDGDRVVVRLLRHTREERPEGRIVSVLERAHDTLVGTFHAPRPGASRRSARGSVSPQDRRLGRDVTVRPGTTHSAVDGDLVVVRIVDWGDDQYGPSGEVTEVLGQPGAPGVDSLAVIRAHHLPLSFPEEVEAAAEALRARGVTAADLDGREDLRDRLVFTIDPADARDHDDALSIDAGDDGWTVGIHIADVSHYVRENDVLDAEAARRGTSVYLVDRVVPMLPHALSSDLCSLLPDVDRLTLSLFVDVAGDGTPTGSRLVRGVIRSAHKLSYERAQEVLDGTAGVSADTDAALRELDRVAGLLRAARTARGSIDLDVPEARIHLDAGGEPVDVQKAARLSTHRLVEDLMLLANETIAARAEHAEVPFIYRIHERPDETRMTQLAELVGGLGYRLGGHGAPTPRDLQQLLEEAAGRPESALLSTVVLRSMKQARYAETNLGHFGLAARAYTHFTSPIRRYPDLVVHRLSSALFIDGVAPWLDAEQLGDSARQSSERERAATAAERDSRDLMKVRFMAQHLGAEFAGTIAGVTAFGFFVLIDEFFIEGLVHVSTLDDDFYRHIEEQHALVGERTGRRLRTGDRVEVRVAAVDTELRRIDFQLVSATRSQTRRRSGKPR